MQTIQYRPIEKKDYPMVGEILNQAFGLYRYVPDQQTLDCFKSQYVYGCLSEATYACVAEKDGEVVGVIMGQAKTEYRIGQHLRYVANTLKYSLKMVRFGKKCKAGIEDYKNLHRIYHTFSKRHKGEFDGTLTLFAVNEKCRGLGVGKTLLTGLLDYLQKNKVQHIYLYTDTTCNYGFYEHQGVERLEQQPMTLTKDGKTFQMDVFLYGYAV